MMSKNREGSLLIGIHDRYGKHALRYRGKFKGGYLETRLTVLTYIYMYFYIDC